MLASLNHHLCLSPKQNLGGLKFQYVREVETVVAQWVITVHRLLSTGTSEAPPTMTDTLTVSGTVWKRIGLAIQLKYFLFLLELKIKNPVICEL
jgi:hypothetical protein